MVATLRYAPPKLGNCCRCFSKTPATTTMDLTLGEDTYRFRFCESHADMFQTQMFGWTRVGEPLLPLPGRPSIPAPAARFGSSRRIPLPDPLPVVEETEPEPSWSDEVPDDVRKLAQSAPGVIDWRLTNTARLRAEEAGVSLFDVLLAAEAPDHIKPSGQDPSSSLHTRGEVTAIVNESTKVVLTMFRKEERLRGNQAS